MIKRWAELDKLAKGGDWAVDPDDRPDMEWNNHIVLKDDPNMAVCFMTHNPFDNTALQASAELIVFLRNRSAQLRKVVEAAMKVAEFSSSDAPDYEAKQELRKALDGLEGR